MGDNPCFKDLKHTSIGALSDRAALLGPIADVTILVASGVTDEHALDYAAAQLHHLRVHCKIVLKWVETGSGSHCGCYGGCAPTDGATAC
jgi:hypothetical protein